MTWQDRILPAAYTPDGGDRLAFSYEDVSAVFTNKGTAFDFPDADGTYVQSTGKTGRRFPLRVFFWGPEYDTEAAAFIDALATGGRLEHPAYGVVDVVPLGDITRRDDLKTAANQAVIEVTFWETTGLVYPAEQSDAGAELLQALGDYAPAAAADFADGIEVASAVQRVTLRNQYSAVLDRTTSALQTIADAQQAVQQQFNLIVQSVRQGLDVLITEPLTLAFQTVQLIEAPARVTELIGARLDAYAALADALISGDGAVVSPDNANEFYAANLYATTYVAASVRSTVNAQFETRPQAIAAAESVLGLFEQVEAWREANFNAIGAVDAGAAYQQLQEATALAAGYLVRLSFNLKQERRIVLGRPRTIIDLAAELYGEVDPVLDFLISSNSLTGSEILELPAGREIVYYV